MVRLHAHGPRGDGACGEPGRVGAGVEHRRAGRGWFEGSAAPGRRPDRRPDRSWRGRLDRDCDRPWRGVAACLRRGCRSTHPGRARHRRSVVDAGLAERAGQRRLGDLRRRPVPGGIRPAGRVLGAGATDVAGRRRERPAPARAARRERRQRRGDHRRHGPAGPRLGRTAGAVVLRVPPARDRG